MPFVRGRGQPSLPDPREWASTPGRWQCHDERVHRVGGVGRSARSRSTVRDVARAGRSGLRAGGPVDPAGCSSAHAPSGHADCVAEHRRASKRSTRPALPGSRAEGWSQGRPLIRHCTPPWVPLGSGAGPLNRGSFPWSRPRINPGDDVAGGRGPYAVRVTTRPRASRPWCPGSSTRRSRWGCRRCRSSRSPAAPPPQADGPAERHPPLLETLPLIVRRRWPIPVLPSRSRRRSPTHSSLEGQVSTRASGPWSRCSPWPSAMTDGCRLRPGFSSAASFPAVIVVKVGGRADRGHRLPLDDARCRRRAGPRRLVPDARPLRRRDRGERAPPGGRTRGPFAEGRRGRTRTDRPRAA